MTLLFRVTVVCVLFIGIYFDFAFALQVKDFFNRVVVVKQLGVKDVDVFFDVLKFFDSSSIAKPSSPSYKYIAWQGICVNSNGQPCQDQYTSKSSIKKAYGRAYGLKDPPNQLFDKFDNEHVVTETTARVNGDHLLISSKHVKGDVYYKADFEVRFSEAFQKKEVLFSEPISDYPNRKSIQVESASFKRLGHGVVQLVSGPKQATDLLGNPIKSGTGFFVTQSGLLVTNHHVVSSYPDCMSKLECLLTFRRVDSEYKESIFKAKAYLYAESEGFDFALLKVNVPQAIGIIPLEIEENGLGPDVVTLGFPSDRTYLETESFDLTVSKGVLTGFNFRTLVSSTYVYSGASGSPLLNEKNQKVIGVISNTAGKIADGGSPAIVRPIDLINHQFDLIDYIKGKKQDRVYNLVQELNQTESIMMAKKLLEQYRKENTFLGIADLNKLMISHRVPLVRKEIFSVLQQMKIIRGVLSQ